MKEGVRKKETKLLSPSLFIFGRTYMYQYLLSLTHTLASYLIP